jgi:hypothetical protein
VKNKIDNDWKKKITLPEAKKISKKKYEANRIILNSLKKYAEEK